MTARGKRCSRGHDDWRASGGCAECNRLNTRRRNRLRRGVDHVQTLWELAKARAKRKMLPFLITAEELAAAWPADNRCPILGIPLQVGTGFTRDGSPSVDRINGEWGYVPGNVAIISHRANRAKGAMQAWELEAIARWMRTNGMA